MGRQQGEGCPSSQHIRPCRVEPQPRYQLALWTEGTAHALRSHCQSIADSEPGLGLKPLILVGGREMVLYSLDPCPLPQPVDKSQRLIHF